VAARPSETRYLKNYDQFRAGVEAMFDMPERTLSTLFAFLRQNGGRLSERAREKEFVELTAGEVAQIEELYRTHFAEGTA
jgi:hypothetical protein